MEKIIRFKKNWEESYIRINMVDGEFIEIDTPLAMFTKRFRELLDIPVSRFKSTETIKREVEEAIVRAFETTIYELKAETKRI